MICIGALLWVLDAFLGVSSGSGASAALPMMSGFLAGQFMVRDTGNALPKGRMWRDAFVFTLIACVVSFGLAGLLVVASGMTPYVAAFLAEIGAVIIVFAVGFAFLLSFLLIRVGYGLGIRTELKSQGQR